MEQLGHLATRVVLALRGNDGHPALLKFLLSALLSLFLIPVLVSGAVLGTLSAYPETVLSADLSERTADLQAYGTLQGWEKPVLEALCVLGEMSPDFPYLSGHEAIWDSFYLLFIEARDPTDLQTRLMSAGFTDMESEVSSFLWDICHPSE